MNSIEKDQRGEYVDPRIRKINPSLQCEEDHPEWLTGIH